MPTQPRDNRAHARPRRCIASLRHHDHHSLLDTDLYKFTMMQVVLHHFPGAQVEYRFKCRNPGVDLAPFVERDPGGDPAAVPLRSRTPSSTTCARCASSRATSSTSWACSSSTSGTSSIARRRPSGEIDITIDGPWLHTILFEMPVLAIVNEVYFRNTQPSPTSPKAAGGCEAKIEQMQGDRRCRTSRSPTTARAAASRRTGTTR